MASEPKNKKLYSYVKGLANKKFKSKSGVYRSSWIVREYKKRGGTYKNGSSKTSKNGLKRWYKEKWVDLNRPIRNSKGKIVGYKSCGRPSSDMKSKRYPLCRPSKRISPRTPRTYKQISKRSLSRAKREKSKVKGSKNIKFGGNQKTYEFHDSFIKVCKCEEEKCKCDSKRESKKCIDGKCEMVKIPEGKKQILESYYKQTGGKVYKCKLCDYSTSSKVHMLKHKLRHMGEKKYKCDKCDYITHRKEKVDLHKMKQHGGVNKELDDIIKKRDKKSNKVKKRTKEDVYYTCPICIKRFSRKDHTFRHLSGVHKDDKTVKEMKDLDKWYKESLSDDFKGINMDLEGGSAQYYGKRSSKMIKIPENVRRTAKYAFKLKKLGFKGGIETGWKRAKQLANRDSIPIQDLKYMRAWFARHLYTSYPTYRKWKKAGRPKGPEWHNKRGIQAWLIWSGDAGFKWVNSTKNINALNKHYNKKYKKLKLRA